jgi:hypothetical protein
VDKTAVITKYGESEVIKDVLGTYNYSGEMYKITNRTYAKSIDYYRRTSSYILRNNNLI